MCNRLDTIPACDRRTDGRLATHSPHYAYVVKMKRYIGQTTA